MDPRGELKPGRDFLITLAVSVLVACVIFSAPGPVFPVLHTILNTGIALVTLVVSLLFWDLGWRTAQGFVRFMAILFAVVAFLEILHVLAALEPASASPALNDLWRKLRSGTWAPPAYLLPAGLVFLLLLQPSGRSSKALFAAVIVVVAGGLFAFFQWLPRYAEPGFLNIIRPSLLLVPLLWIPVAMAAWQRRTVDPIAHALTWYAMGLGISHVLMLYSDEATSRFAMAAHFGVFAAGLNLLLGVIQMGTAETARRMQAESELKLGNEVLEARVRDRTAALEDTNTQLRREADVREAAERHLRVQLERLELLRRITHAIAERQDLHSIFQVVVRSLEEHLPADFAAMCDYDHRLRRLTVSRVGTRSEPLAMNLAMTENSRIEIDENGLSRCVAGKLVYEPDIVDIKFPFPQRLASARLRSMVIVPLMVEQRSGVFGVLVLARHTANSFSSGDCEFLRQLCDHVSLAANQAQLHESLKRAYDDLQLSQNAVMQQERLRALGQMASGIAHDINNAISPVSLYVEALLAHETGFSDRARKQLEVIQRGVDDVAHTVSRMNEFYRQRPTQTQLLPVDVNAVLHDVLELTRARWSDMAQRRGAVIETRIDTGGESHIVNAIESEIREALINLVFNATDAMPEGGTLTLRTGYALEAGKGVARRVYIEVSDTGMGMDEDTRRRCLEPFFTTKGDRGSGLGLAMVYGIAQRHGVDIDLHSAPGEGTTFRLTFALTAPAPQSTGSVRVQKIPTHTKILLVDDDPLLLSSLREILVNEGHQVQTANGGRAGIDAFMDSLNSGKPFPVVITDLGMPHVDGRAVAVAVSVAAPATAIIMLTGWGQRLAASGEIPPGVSVVMSKPPKIAELRQWLAEFTGSSEIGS